MRRTPATAATGTPLSSRPSARRVVAANTFFVRPGSGLLEVVHVHKYTFGPRFRLHLGVRVCFDRFVAQALNGPAFDGAPGASEPGVQGRFNYRSDVEAIEACAEAMKQTVETVGTEWFDAMINPEELLAIHRSPTTPISIDEMEIALEDPGAVVTSDETRRAFNVGWRIESSIGHERQLATGSFAVG